MRQQLSLTDLRDDSSMPFLIRQIRDNILRLVEREIKADDIEINYSQYLVVKILVKTGPQMSSELARFLNHNAGAMTRLIDQLVAKKLVRRKPHAQDRRALTIELTPTGQTLWRSMSQYVERVQKLALRDLSTADRTTLFKLLKRVRNTLNETA